VFRVERTKKRRAPKRQRPEAILHKQVIAYLARALPLRAFHSTLFNGGHGHFIRGAMLSTIGVRRGLPDILVLHEGKAYGIELKSNIGRLSGHQHECHAALNDARVPVRVCRSVEDVHRFLVTDCGLNLRARPA
jgi:hypothetical protein